MTYRSELVSFSCPSATVLAYKELSTGSLVSVERRASQQVPYQFKMKHYQQFSLLVIIVVLFSAALSCNPGSKPEEASSRPGTLPADWDEDLNSGEFSGHECGPVHGKCPHEQCCSLRNECGNSTSHCNLSLGCKKKWGICH